jgi:hypothetical protein
LKKEGKKTSESMLRHQVSRSWSTSAGLASRSVAHTGAEGMQAARLFRSSSAKIASPSWPFAGNLHSHHHHASRLRTGLQSELRLSALARRFFASSSYAGTLPISLFIFIYSFFLLKRINKY